MVAHVTIVGEVYRCIWAHRGVLLKGAAPALVLCIARELAHQYCIDRGLLREISPWFVLDVGVAIVAGLLLSRLLTGWHRFVIRGEPASGTWWTIDRADALFYLAGCALGVPLVLPQHLYSILPPILVLVAAVPIWGAWGWLWVRNIFLFPLIALRERDTVRVAWALGRSNLWRIVLAMVGVGLPLIGVVLLLSLPSLAGPAGNLPVRVFQAFVDGIFSVVSGIVFATLVSRLFLRRTGSVEPPS